MPLAHTALALIYLLHRGGCIASSPDGSACPGRIDNIKRDIAYIQLCLSDQESSPENRARSLRTAAKLMICDNHTDRSQEARRVARRWEKEAAQHTHATMRPLTSIHISSCSQPPDAHRAEGGGIEGSPRRPAIDSLRPAVTTPHRIRSTYTRPAGLLEPPSPASTDHRSCVKYCTRVTSIRCRQSGLHPTELLHRDTESPRGHCH